MSNTLFPTLPGLAWGLTKKPKWNTRVQRSVSGKRQAIGYMSYPLYEWTLSFNVLRQHSSFTELEQLQGFFNSMRGQFDTFLFADPEDAVATTQAFGIGDGVSKDFQLARTYGGFTEPVFAPALISDLRKAGVSQSNPGNYTLGANGLIQFGTAPAAGNVLDWTGTFRFRCAFTNDTLELINSDGVDLWKTNKISFESVKP